MRRKGMKVGEMAATAAEPTIPAVVTLNDREWEVLMVLKRDFAASEITENLWELRATYAGIYPEIFFEVAEELDRKGVIGRFSTFLEHTKPVGGEGERLSSFNGLFHWAVPAGKEIQAGREIGRFAILTHCYWRDAGPELNNVNIMAVAHGMEKSLVHAHKEAIDAHLASAGIPVSYTNVFWGGRSEIKPSEILPSQYREWCEKMGVDPEAMRA